MQRARWLSVLLTVGLASPSVATARSAGPAPRAKGTAEPGERPSAEASWPVLNGCIDDPRLDPGAGQDFAQAWPRMHECGEAARTIVVAGTDADRERLWSVFDEWPEGSRLAGDALDAFLDWHVERALVALESSALPPATDAPAADLKVPEFLREAPAELQQAWRSYQAVVQTRRKGREGRSADDAIGFQSNQPAFRRVVAGFLRGRVPAAETVLEVSRYEWSGWCGTGSDLLYEPQSKALVIAHLQLGRVELALAASEGLAGSHLLAHGPTARWDRRLIAAAGIDWERFYLGGVLSGQDGMADTLARHGSDRAARQLLAAAHILEAAAPPESSAGSEVLLWPLAALVEPSADCTASRGSWDSREIGRDPAAEPIGADVQAGVLDLLADNVGPGAGLNQAEAASRLLLQLCRIESRPAFHAMLRSPYEEVRKQGATALRALGETVADPRPSSPVGFRIVVDGRPACRRRVHWALRSPAGEVSSSIESDDEGVVRLARDAFLDPRRPVVSVRLSAPDIASAGDVWFEAGLDVPADLDAVGTVSVRTGSLAVVIPQSLLTGHGQRPPTLHLQTETTRYGVGATMLPVSRDLPVVSTRVTFPRLQHGRYQVWLRHGPRVYASPDVEVGEHPSTVTVRERSIDEDLAEALTPR